MNVRMLFGIIIVFCVLIPEVEFPPQDPGASGPDFGGTEPLDSRVNYVPDTLQPSREPSRWNGSAS